MPYLYMGEAVGARIVRYGVGFSQVGDAYNLDVKTLEQRPAGEVGDVAFRTIDVLVRHKLGFNIEITPELDGKVLAPQTFTRPAPSNGQLEIWPIQAYVGRRGSTIVARVRTVTLLGETEIVNIASSNVPIRVTP